jgi:hypothetical protein
MVLVLALVIACNPLRLSPHGSTCHDKPIASSRDMPGIKNKPSSPTVFERSELARLACCLLPSPHAPWCLSWHSAPPTAQPPCQLPSSCIPNQRLPKQLARTTEAVVSDGGETAAHPSSRASQGRGWSLRAREGKGFVDWSWARISGVGCAERYLSVVVGSLCRRREFRAGLSRCLWMD